MYKVFHRQSFEWGPLYLCYCPPRVWALGFVMYQFGFGLYLGPLEFLINGYEDIALKDEELGS